MQKALLYLLVAAVLGLGTFAFQQHRLITDRNRVVAALEKSIAARDQFVADAQKAARKVEEQNRAFVAESAALRDKLAEKSQPEPAPTAAPSSPEPAGSKNPFGGMMEKMMKNPKMLEAISSQQMAVLKPMYADLMKQLKLTPEEAGKFFELLSSQTTQAMQAGMQAMSGDKKAFDQLSGVTEEMKSFLGDRYATYEAYQKSIPDRAQLMQISSQMALRQTPLRPDQSAGLLQIMQQEKLNTTRFTAAANDPKTTRFSDQTIPDTMAAQEERNSRILARSKTLLSPEQWNALAEQQKQTLQMQKVGMEMTKGMFSRPAK